jgi:TPR repeat protein
MYERGDGPAKDRSAAIRFYQKACSVGYDQSCKALRRLKASP